MARALPRRPRWLARAEPLGPGAPPWARRMYARSLLVLRALTDAAAAPSAAGARDRWAYVWPRDAAAVAIALADAGYRPRRAASSASSRARPRDGARFRGDGEPVTDGRALPGDAAGWVRAAARGRRARRPPPLAGPPGAAAATTASAADDSGDYLANAIAAGVPARRDPSLFGGAARAACRRAGDPESGARLGRRLGGAAVPATRRFSATRASLLALAAERGGRYGIEPHRGLARTEPGPRPPPGAPGAWRRWASATRRCDCSPRVRRAATPPARSPSGSTRPAACPLRRPRSAGRMPSRLWRCSSSGPRR